MKPDAKTLEKFRAKTRTLANATKFDQVRKLALELLREYPGYIEFEYKAIVYEFEDDSGYSPAQLKRRHAQAAKGVGAAEVAKIYALRGRRALCVRWAKIAEQAWLNFFEVTATWSNSYLFYAAALGYQGRFDEMEKALVRTARLAKRPVTWPIVSQYRREILKGAKAAGFEIPKTPKKRAA